MQGTRAAAAVRPRSVGQRHATRAPVHGPGVVHVVRGRADRRDLLETGLSAVPVTVPVTVRVRGPVGRTTPGARGSGTGGVQPRVRHRLRVLRVAQKRVLLRARRPPEPNVRVPVRARVARRTGPRDGDTGARGRRGRPGRRRRRREPVVVLHGDGRADRPAAVRVRRR